MNPEFSKSNYMKHQNINFNINQVQILRNDRNYESNAAKSPSFSMGSETNSVDKNAQSKRYISNELKRKDTPIFNHILKRSNSFGNSIENAKSNLTEFNPRLEESLEGQGDKFSFRNPLILKVGGQLGSNNKYFKHVIKSNTQDKYPLEEPGVVKKKFHLTNTNSPKK